LKVLPLTAGSPGLTAISFCYESGVCQFNFTAVKFLFLLAIFKENGGNYFFRLESTLLIA